MKFLGFAISMVLSVNALAADRIIVHEWGTFTVLQDENGKAIHGINTDDERLPDFVHTLPRPIIHASTPLTPALGKALPECHPDVKLRLETPVTYFYLPKNYTGSKTINVSVKFHGGWLTEFYPSASIVSPVADAENRIPANIPPDTTGELTWNLLQLDAASGGLATDSKVWTAPRATRSVNIKTPYDESEKFLFYRGVGNIDAPLRVEYTFEGNVLRVHPGANPSGTSIDEIEIANLWLVDVAEDGTVAYAELGPLTTTRRSPGEFPLDVHAAPHTTRNLSVLRASMHAALIADGLYTDEAAAMLNTWESSYFKNPGTRLFFLVPHDWTDAALPIQFSLPVEITRTMMGRVELISPEQRARMRTISMTKVLDYPATMKQLRRLLTPTNGRALLTNTEAMGLNLPQPYGDFLRLGRFRSALVLHEAATRPTENLSAFIANMRIASNY